METLVFQPSAMTRKVAVPIRIMGGEVRQLLHRVLVKELEGRCASAGFVRPESIQVVEFSSAVLYGDGAHVTVTFTCDVAHPTVGDVLSCVIEEKTHAGLKCKLNSEVYDVETSPFVIFVARDHRNTLSKFAKMTEGEDVQVTVVGARFELHDPYISVIGTLTVEEEAGEDELFEGTLQKYESIQLREIRANREKIFVVANVKGDEKELLKEPNVVQLRTTYRDSNLETNKKAIDRDVDLIQQSKDIVFPASFGDNLKNEPETYAYLMQKLAMAGIIDEEEDEEEEDDEEDEEEEDEAEDED